MCATWPTYQENRPHACWLCPFAHIVVQLRPLMDLWLCIPRYADRALLVRFITFSLVSAHAKDSQTLTAVKLPHMHIWFRFTRGPSARLLGWSACDWSSPVSNKFTSLDTKEKVCRCVARGNCKKPGRWLVVAKAALLKILRWELAEQLSNTSPQSTNICWGDRLRSRQRTKMKEFE
jgi:hypothetical protein